MIGGSERRADWAVPVETVEHQAGLVGQIGLASVVGQLVCRTVTLPKACRSSVPCTMDNMKDTGESKLPMFTPMSSNSFHDRTSLEAMQLCILGTSCHKQTWGGSC